MFQLLISRQTFSEFLFPLRAGWPLPSQHVCVAYVIDEKVLPSVVLIVVFAVVVAAVLKIITSIMHIFTLFRMRR